MHQEAWPSGRWLSVSLDPLPELPSAWSSRDCLCSILCWTLGQAWMKTREPLVPMVILRAESWPSQLSLDAPSLLHSRPLLLGPPVDTYPSLFD